ncbi:MAG TPA: molybdopterin-binding/glycosyltransferase family 2 protein [Stellaceae bacterium]|nr:molybdopterin-binding/glycosyltransferase family 2 protein [Stellaceae bacterium]
MKFGEVPVGEAAGAILAHSLKFGQTALKKGRVLSAEDVAVLAAAGIAHVVAARLDPGDLREDTAADRVAAVVAGRNIVAAPAFTGRANLFAEAKGVLVFDRDRLDRLNLVDEAVTLGTLPPYAVVEPRQMVATVKIIPFAVAERAVARAADFAAEGGGLLRVAAFLPLRVALIQTRLPGLKESILDKTRAVTEHRLGPLGSALAADERCDHRVADLAPHIAAAVEAGAQLVLVHGASVIVDRRDVIPAAIEAAGGRIEHFGMPVDPGNMLLLGRLGGAPVLGLPGCARSPKENGFDWVLQRLCAGLAVGKEDIMKMGAGGLLAEIPSRPLPRAEVGPAPVASPADGGRTAAAPKAGPRIAALLLAAGRSSRMGGPNKLLEPLDGTPMVARTARRLLSSRARPIVAVLGNDAERVDAALGRLPVERVRNPAFADGLSTSLKCGLAALPADIDGVVVCLGDMPLIAGRDIDRLIAAFNPLEGRAIIVPMRRGKRGNPVLWAQRFLPEMAELAGDVGARHLIGEHAELVYEVEMDSDGVLVDIDTPDALAALRDRLKPTAA